MMDFSIIVCTRNRAGKLHDTLASIAEAIRLVPDKTAEVVIVDNGSTDDTQQVIKRWVESVSFPVANIYESRPGLSAARNAGISASSGNILAFTDDDCTLNSDYLKVLDRYFSKDKELVMRGGRVELGDPTDLPYTIREGEHAERLTDNNRLGGFIIGANMALSRDLVKKIGMFDERLGAGTKIKSAEDTDYIYRIFKAGFVVEYVPDLVVKHFHGRKDRESILRLCEGYFIGNGALYAKYLSDLKLLRQFYWDCRTYFLSPLTGNRMLDSTIGLSNRSVIVNNIRGFLLYFKEALRFYSNRLKNINE